MKLIDSNIVIYAIGREHPLRENCRVIMSEAYSGELDANVNVELLQEVLHYYHRRGATDTGLRVCHDLMTGFRVPFTVNRETARIAADLLARHRQIQSRDAFHAAVVFENGLEGIISADRGFDGIFGLKRFDPLELGKTW